MDRATLMRGRRLQIRSTQWGMVLVTLAILVLVNLLGATWFVRLDMTEDREFTPSEGTRQMLEALDDPVMVRAYFTRDLPPPYNRTTQILRDLLDEYRVLSDGRVNYEFLDPADEGPGDEQRMMMLGIPKVQVTDVSSDKVQVRNGYMGVTLQFEDRQEVIPVLQGGQGLEYLLTSKIRKLTGTGRKRVGVVQGFGAPDLNADMGRVVQAIGEQYEVQGVDLEQGSPMPEGLDVLLVVEPTESLSEAAQAEVDRFLVSGGGVGILAGGVSTDPNFQSAREFPERFDKLFSVYGLTVGRNLVGDPDNLRITVSQRRGIFTMQNIVDYPYIPVLRDVSPDNVVVSGLEGLFLPFVSTVQATPVDGVTYTPLLRSSPGSWLRTAPFDIQPLQSWDPRLFSHLPHGPQTVAVAGEGQFPSAFSGGTATPSGENGEKEASAPVPAPGRLLVVGSGGFMTDAYLMSGEDIPFVMNVIDWLARDEALIGLRSRGVTDRPLHEVGEGARQGIKAVNMLGGALALIVLGLIRWKVRTVARRHLEAA